jgi:methanogenic corrinoid protein MtbC1
VYSIGTVSKLSGVAVETIRIWERRYGTPTPTRTAGGHRKYSDDDVALLRALKALTEQGVRIGALAGEPREAILQAAGLVASPTAAAAPPDGLDGIDFTAVVDGVVDAGLRKDTAGAAALLNRPLLHRHPREVILGLYLPILREVGDRWHRGELDVATEHFIEKQVTGRLHSILLNQGEQSHGRRAVLACVPTERHEAALLAAAVLLSLAGYDTTYLGADLPLDDLLQTVAQTEPRLVILSSTVELPPALLNEVVETLDAPILRATTVVLGGAGGAAIAGKSSSPLTLASDLEELESLAREIAAAT